MRSISELLVLILAASALGTGQSASAPLAAGQFSASLVFRAAQPDSPDSDFAAVVPSQSATPEQKRIEKSPNLTDPYFPLSPRQKLSRWEEHIYSPYTFASVAISAGFSEITFKDLVRRAWPAYGGGFQGYGKRFGATLADTELSGFLDTYFLPLVLHQDPRYFHMNDGPKFSRGLYAASRVLITRKDTGNTTFNSSELLGRLFLRSMENAYYPPPNRGLRTTISGTAEGMLGDALSNVLREFSPEIRRAFRQHEPERVKRAEARLPKRIQKMEQDW